MKTSFVYSEQFSKYDYGINHPMKQARLKLTFELIAAYGLLELPGTELVEPVTATKKELLTVHSEDYIHAVHQAEKGLLPNPHKYGLGTGDNPIFEGLYEGSTLSVGASLAGAKAVADNFQVAFNIAGGLHHAHKDRASGFCYFNDPAIAIHALKERGFRVCYIDIDAHHGDGVQQVFYETNEVLTISFHESGQFLFPGTGFPQELGGGNGYGYSLNIPLWPGTDDEVFLKTFFNIVPAALEKFHPDFIVTQLGVDSLASDPLTHLYLTTNGFSEAVKFFKTTGIKWLALGGGGYDIGNVARAWTIAWAIMNEVEIPPHLPSQFIQTHPEVHFPSDRLEDTHLEASPDTKNHAHKAADEAITYLYSHSPLLNTT